MRTPKTGRGGPHELDPPRPPRCGRSARTVRAGRMPDVRRRAARRAGTETRKGSRRAPPRAGGNRATPPDAPAPVRTVSAEEVILRLTPSVAQLPVNSPYRRSTGWTPARDGDRAVAAGPTPALRLPRPATRSPYPACPRSDSSVPKRGPRWSSDRRRHRSRSAAVAGGVWRRLEDGADEVTLG